MRNAIRRMICFCLCILISCPLGFRVSAEEDPAETKRTLTIDNRAEFLAFAENCRLDAYSRDLQVFLKSDIDLTGLDFEGIPIFCGTFDGENHIISGLSVQREGSVIGLFRYLEKNSHVRNLRVEGNISPEGSRSTVGGVVGSNAGRIENCRFIGVVSGTDYVGGVAGTNEVSGIIHGCSVEGTVVGNHFVGGIAGHNLGVIRNSYNKGYINTTAAQNKVNISDITIETLTGVESAETVTDIGGIVGRNTGVIRDCSNTGTVGYRHIGYNLGGIAGSQAGYIASSINYGSVFGRKEVGGIVGHMEPITYVRFAEDMLQTLEKQLSSIGGLTNQAISGAFGASDNIAGAMENLSQELEDASDALTELLPEGKVPDKDTVQAAQNALSSSITGIQNSMQGITDAANQSTDKTVGALRSILAQVGAMSATLKSAEESVGGKILDISERDTEADTTGKVEGCANHGEVLGDLNVGGIAGAMALENDLDHEEDIRFGENDSMNYEAELRCVILNCQNKGAVSIRRKNAGGIVGWMAIGLVKDCVNTGDIAGDTADHIGGIAGISDGTLRGNDAKCSLTGSQAVGGIAGYGTKVTDCRSMTVISAREKVGGILGYWKGDNEPVEETEKLPVSVWGKPQEKEPALPPVYGNYYLITDKNVGGIDGISYDTVAQPLTSAEFYKLDGLNDMFRYVMIRFAFDDGRIKTVKLTPGAALSDTDIPELPEKEGYLASWEGLASFNRKRVVFDRTFHASYRKLTQTIESEQLSESGLPMVLAQGQFVGEQNVVIREIQPPKLETDGNTIGCWQFEILNGSVNRLRYLYTGEGDLSELHVYLRDSSDNWREGQLQKNSMYLVFDVNGEDTAFCLTEEGSIPVGIVATSCCGVLLLAAVLIVLLKKRK